MPRNPKKISVSGTIVLVLVLLNVIILEKGFTANKEWYSLLVVTVPLLMVALIKGHRRML
jgi:hypothetical protein